MVSIYEYKIDNISTGWPRTCIWTNRKRCSATPLQVHLKLEGCLETQYLFTASGRKVASGSCSNKDCQFLNRNNCSRTWVLSKAYTGESKTVGVKWSQHWRVEDLESFGILVWTSDSVDWCQTVVEPRWSCQILSESKRISLQKAEFGKAETVVKDIWYSGKPW